MRKPLIVVRALGILLGGFLVAGLVLDLLGILPHSETPQSPGARFADSIPLAAGAVLLIPFRRIRRRPVRIAAGSVLGLLTLYIVGVSVDGVAGYLAGARSWHLLPAAAFLSIVSLCNLWAFLRISSESSPVSGKRRPTGG